MLQRLNSLMGTRFFKIIDNFTKVYYCRKEDYFVYMWSGTYFACLCMGVIKLHHEFLSQVQDSPIIAAVNDQKKIEPAIHSPCDIIFLLSGSIFNNNY